MDRYFFDLHDGQSYPDGEGAILPDLASVRREAILYVGALLTTEPDAFWNAQEWRMDVTDAHRTVLFTVTIDAFSSPMLGGRTRSVD